MIRVPSIGMIRLTKGSLSMQGVNAFILYKFVRLTFKVLTRTTPNPPKSSKGHFLEKFSTVVNWYFHLFKWGKITTWQEVQAINTKYERSTKMHGAF